MTCACGDQTEHPIGICPICVASPSPEQAARLAGARLAYLDAIDIAADAEARDDGTAQRITDALRIVLAYDCGPEE